MEKDSNEYSPVSEQTKETKLKWLNGQPESASSSSGHHKIGNGDDRNVRFTRSSERVDVLPKMPPVKRIPTRMEMKTLTHLAKRPAVTIDFSDLCYSVRNNSNAGVKGQIQILKGVTGSFKTGEVTAIMGSSGAGKSTLMNILAGYVTHGVSGVIRTNGYPRQLKFFRKLSAYIMQDDLIQPFLTVEESLQVAANLKLGRELRHREKLLVVEEIIQTLGLETCRNTRTEKISGGQRKRLSIALELVNNPPVLFLDEPTTGLDVVSTSQLIDLLEKLASQGRTIICTVHQPTASVFKQFDHVYVVARGYCVYQGTNEQLVPFLSTAGLECPITHNPADFIIEIIQIENADCVDMLKDEIQNGKISMGSTDDKKTSTNEVVKACRRETLATLPPFYKSGVDPLDSDVDFPTTFCEQFWILLKRKMLQQSRNMVIIWIMLFHHLLCGLLVGMIFSAVGNDAARPFDNFKFVICVVVFVMYTHLMTNVLLFPSEVALLHREYFNRWYGLKSYFAALSLSTLHMHLIFGCIFSAATYYFSDQPIEATRIALFLLGGLFVGLASEGLGLTVGSIFSITNGCVVGPVVIVPMLAVAVYGMGYGKAVEPVMQFFMQLSYLRYGITSLSMVLYDNGRARLECSEPYCHYQDPSILLKDLGMEGFSMFNQLLGLSVFAVIYRLTAYTALRFRLSTGFSSKILNYVTKIIKSN